MDILTPSPFRLTISDFLFRSCNIAALVLLYTLSDERIGLSLMDMLGLCQVYVSHIQHVLGSVWPAQKTPFLAVP
jgi:hypothetical protein